MDNPKYPALTTVANFPLFPVLSITSTTATTMMSANITSQGGPTPHALDRATHGGYAARKAEFGFGKQH